ncbi:TadE family type IV pilus minor pilin [Kitasatospora sp. NPDC006786]|uniref:TadE family type IV pilus minor pilin n=1 Tax=unclassified Kitasatospora TaxID=2633591 RepID=UPI0033FB79B8
MVVGRRRSPARRPGGAPATAARGTLLDAAPPALPVGGRQLKTASGRAGERGAGRARPLRPRGDAGFVTAETAVALPALVLLAAMLIWGVLAAATQIRCVDAARVGARAAARGETDAAELARAAAPAGAQVRVSLAADTVRVEVEAPCAGPGRLGGLLAVRLSAAAVAAREDVLVAVTAGGGGPWPS